ncbi:MAG TPA: DUF3618 domain-containing protein [Solirubrobacteraceae bacterium]|jgi:hypothetical protein|nr:DUF3618 domain-containing protein [Solirubrobacteraceae bacterium]
MGEDQGAVSASVTENRTGGQTPEDPEQLREDIERTRQDLGDTVAALAEKTDVKARAKEKVAEVRQNVNHKRTELVGRARETSPGGASSAAVQVRTKAQENPIHTAAIAAFVGGFLLGRITAR